MSRYVFKMPDLGEGTVSAEVVEWKVKVGDMVTEDQIIAEVMTDKAAVEIPAPVSGRVVSLSGQPGEMVAVGAELIAFETSGSAADAAAPAAAPAAASPRRWPAPRRHRQRQRRRLHAAAAPIARHGVACDTAQGPRRGRRSHDRQRHGPGRAHLRAGPRVRHRGQGRRAARSR